MRKEPPQDKSIKDKDLEKRVKAVERGISSLFEILLKAGVISEGGAHPPDTVAPPGKAPAARSSRRISTNKASKEETLRSVEFLIYSSRRPRAGDAKPS
jgi:hypothetical protein